MGAVWFRLRADARRRWRAWLLLTVLVGLAGGAVLASVAGARRTDSAFDRFLAWSGSTDAVVFTGAAPLDVEAIRALPEVEEAGEARFAWMVGENGVSDLDPIYMVDDGGAARFERPKVLAGRRPDPRRAEEAAITPVGARLTGLGVGDTVALTGLAPEQLEEAFSGGNPEPAGPTVRFRIVGVEAYQSEFIQDASLHLTPAFGRRYGEQVATIPSIGVRLERRAADVPSFAAGVQRVSGGEQVQVDATAEAAREVNRSVDIQAVALRLFAALAAVAGVVILSQALGREASFLAPDQWVLRALGTTRPQLLAVAALRSLAIGVVGAAVAVAVAVLVSPHVLFGLARDVEPSPGTSFDRLVVATGVVVLLLVVVVAGVVPAWRASRSELALDRSEAGTAAPSRAVAVLSRAGMSPSAVTGVRMALEPGRGRAAVPTRTALVGTTLSLAALVTALTFGASLHNLFDTPRLYGWNWDAVVGSPFDEDTTERIVPMLTDNEAVGEFSLVSYAEVQLEGVRLRALGFDTAQGSVLPPVVQGREPRRPDEIVVGAKTLRQLGRSVGDRVEVRAGDEVATMRIIGRGVLPALGEGDEGGLGEGAFVTSEGLRRLVAEVPTNLYAVRWEPGSRAPVDELREFGLTTAAPPKGVADFNRVDDLPVVLSALLVLVAAGTLAHTLVTGVKRRRRDLAILKTLGFVRRQVWATVGWQSTTVVGVALVCGVPLGLAGGRWLWRYFADELGTVPHPVTPLMAVLLLVAVTLVGANVLAALPGRSAARTHPALVLRSE